MAILTKNNINFNETTQDVSGRILAINLVIENKTIRIINIYGPNDPQHKEIFYYQIRKHARGSDYMILTGDLTWLKTLT